MVDITEIEEEYGLWAKYVLALLYAKNKEPVQGSLKLQKELFLLSRSIKALREEDIFEAHFLGPYSEELEEDIINSLELDGLIKISNKKGKIYMLTQEGERIARKVYESLDEKERKIIEWVKDLLNDLNNEEVLALIYFAYPRMAKHSTKIDKILKNKKDLALNLYKKGKISLKKAIEIAGNDILMEV